MQPSISQYFAARQQPQSQQLQRSSSGLRMSMSQSQQHSTLYPANPLASRPPSANTQLLRKFPGSASQQQMSMSQMSEEQLFLSSSQQRISPAFPLRPRSAPFELPTQASNVATQGSNKDVTALIREVLQELGHCSNGGNRSSSDILAQKQMDKIERSMETQTAAFAQLEAAVQQLTSVAQEALSYSKKPTATVEQSCQTPPSISKAHPPPPAAMPRPSASKGEQPHSQRPVGAGYGPSLRSPLPLASTRAATDPPPAAVRTVEALLQNTAWRQSKSSMSGKSAAAQAPANKSSSKVQQAAWTSSTAQLLQPTPGTKRQYTDVDSSPSTSATDIFGAQEDADQQQRNQPDSAMVDEDELARAVRQAMNRHRSRRMKRARLEA